MANFMRSAFERVMYSDFAMSLRFGDLRGYNGRSLTPVQSVMAVIGVLGCAGVLVVF